jgi:hypothetical protein
MTAPLRDASELLYPHVYATVMSLDIDRDGKDAAMSKLALRLARVIDQAPDGKAQASALWHLGAELHKVLESLGASPAARAAIKRGARDGDGKGKPSSQLDIMRENRARRTRA